MPVKRGEIVLVPVPFTSGSGSKTRPVLVVQTDHNNHRLQDTIVAVITSTTRRATLEPTQLLIELATTEGRRSGLLNDSAVKCERLHTVLQSQIQRTIGSLSAVAMHQIDGCLKAALDIS